MTKNIKSYTLLLLLLSNLIFCQNENQNNKAKIISLLKQSREAYDQNIGFSFKTQNVVYESFTSSKILENTNGKFCKHGTNTYLKIHDGEIAKIDDFTIKIDGNTRLMQIVKSNNNEPQVYDLTSLSKSYTTFTISETASEYKCTLEAEKVSPTPYGKVIIYIDKKTKLIKKQTMFLYSSVFIKNKEYTPRIDMIFSDFIVIKTKPKELLASNYIKKVNSKYYPSKTYEGYQIID